MKLEYRRMLVADLKRVFEIEKSLFPDPWLEVSFRMEVDNMEISFPFVLLLEGNIIGYSICWFYTREVHIGNFAIEKPNQKMGFGNFMLQKIFEVFPDFEIMYLEVREKNKPAISLYEKFGFQVAYRRRGYYRNGEDALIMVKNGG